MLQACLPPTAPWPFRWLTPGWLSLACCVVFLSQARAAEAVAEPAATRRVLVVYENDPTQPAAIQIAEGLRARLARGIEAKFETFTEYLDIQRFSGQENLSRRASDMAAKYRNLPIDVTVGLGPGAVRFLGEHRAEIVPGVPLVFGAVRAESLTGAGLPADVMGVASHFDLRGTIDLARRLQPGANNIVVLTGSSDFDRRWEERARQELSYLSREMQVEYLSDLTVEDFAERVRGLSPDTILLILSVVEDAAGNRPVPAEAAGQLATISGAPSYGVYSTYLGQGIVGGRMESFRSVGEDVGTLVLEALAGKAVPGKIISSAATPIVDWKQMLRWGFDRADLPEDAEIRGFVPSVWEQYRPQILATAAIMMLQTATIAALIVQYRRRRRIGDELALERLELAHLSRIHQLGELSGAFAHELNQPLTSILANAEVGARLLTKEATDKQELGAILQDIISDDKRAAEIISQLRTLMVKGEAKLLPVDLNGTIESTIALANSELVARQTRVRFDRPQTEIEVRGNLAQLQQLILNLLLNAAEAMSGLPAAERHVDVETRKRKDGTCEMAVTDRGPGISSEMKAAVFRPFVSSKENGLGLGLAICRSIALAHGGTLEFEEGRETGATVLLTLPTN